MSRRYSGPKSKPELVFPRIPEEYGLSEDILQKIAARWPKDQICGFCEEPCKSTHWHLKGKQRTGTKTNLRRVYYHKDCCLTCG